GAAGVHPADVPARRIARLPRWAGGARRDRRGFRPDHRTEAVPDADLRDVPPGKRARRRRSRRRGGGRREGNHQGEDMSTKTEPRKIPNPLYAAAGAGELAYEQLRKLPERVAELRGRVAELRPVVSEAVTERVSERNLRADLDKLRDTARDTARRNAQAFVTGAQAAQKQAIAVYTELVARGERVVAGARTEQAKAQLATARAEIRDAEKVEAEALIGEHAEDPQKPAKRTRSAASKGRLAGHAPRPPAAVPRRGGAGPDAQGRCTAAPGSRPGPEHGLDGRRAD